MPQLPNLKGRVQYRQRQPGPSRVWELGGRGSPGEAAWYYEVKKKENKRVNFYYNKAALCQTPGSGTGRLSALRTGRPYDATKLWPPAPQGSVPTIGDPV